MVNIIYADGLAMQGVKASVGKILTWFAWNDIPLEAQGVLTSSFLCSWRLLTNILRLLISSVFHCYPNTVHPLTHCGLVMSYDDVELGQHWLG